MNLRRKRIPCLRYLFAHGIALVMAVPALAGPVVLYDASLGTAPAAQGWFYNSPSGASEAMGSGYVDLDTTSANSIKAGYGRLSPFAIDVNSGFHLRFDVQVSGEAHASNDRAGFSIIAIGSGLTGIELGFWSDRVFAQSQSPLFTHAEQGFFDTTAMTRYDLLLRSSGYELWGAGNLIVSGALRNYSGAFLPPYVIGNSLFLGDDTSSARGDLRLALVEAETLPEPGTLLLSAGALFLCGFGRLWFTRLWFAHHLGRRGE